MPKHGLPLLMLIALQASAGEPVILLTGFEPFGGAKTNTSWEAVKYFQGRTLAGHRIETLQLPVVYDAIEAPLKEAIAKFKPAAVLCFGEGTPTVQIETTAQNGYHAARPLDNKGLPPPRVQILPGGKDTIPTGLPVEAIKTAINSSVSLATTSTDAGGYLCNECFYRLMALPDAPAARGFIHLPAVRAEPMLQTLPELQRAVGIAASLSVGKAPLNILLFADFAPLSTVYPRDRWGALLAQRILAGGHAVRDPQLIVRQPDDPRLILRKPIGQNFDLAIVQVGLFDHLNGTATRRFSIVEALAAIKELKARAVVVSIPDFTATPWGKKNGYDSEISKKKLREFNAKLAEEAEANDAVFVDITPLTVEFAGDPKMTTQDNLLYTEEMYALWADRVYKTLKEKKLLPP